LRHDPSVWASPSARPAVGQRRRSLRHLNVADAEMMPCPERRRRRPSNLHPQAVKIAGRSVPG